MGDMKGRHSDQLWKDDFRTIGEAANSGLRSGSIRPHNVG